MAHTEVWAAAPLLAITDARYSDAHMLRALEALVKVRNNVPLELQVRTGFEDNIAALVSLSARLGIRLWFNRSVTRAQTYGAGFHGSPTEVHAAKCAGLVGPFSAPVHSEHELEAACAEGVNVVVISPVFEVPGKGTPLGMSGLRKLAARTSGRARVIALGGITEVNCTEVLQTPHVDGIAAIRSVWSTYA